MKKQIILFYDPRTKKLIDVCDVRSVDPVKCDQFSKEAKINLERKIREEDEKAAKERARQIEENLQLHSEINELRLVVSHLLGLVELSEEEINSYLHLEESEEESHE